MDDRNEMKTQKKEKKNTSRSSVQHIQWVTTSVLRYVCNWNRSSTENKAARSEAKSRDRWVSNRDESCVAVEEKKSSIKVEATNGMVGRCASTGEPTCNGRRDNSISLVSALSCSRRFGILLSVAFNIRTIAATDTQTKVIHSIDTKYIANDGAELCAAHKTKDKQQQRTQNFQSIVSVRVHVWVCVSVSAGRQNGSIASKNANVKYAPINRWNDRESLFIIRCFVDGSLVDHLRIQWKSFSVRECTRARSHSESDKCSSVQSETLPIIATRLCAIF